MRKDKHAETETKMYTLNQALDHFCSSYAHENVWQVRTREYGGVAVQLGGDWYWVYRVGEYFRNERYACATDILRAIGASDEDRPVWTLETLR